MGDITRVIEGLNEISGYDCQQMSLFDNDVFIRGMAQEAAELLKSQQAEIDHLKTEQQKIIRCKDCGFGYQLDGIYVHCTKPFSGENHTMDWFCADGRKKAGEQE